MAGKRATYSLNIDGVDVSARFRRPLISMSITDKDGGKSDTLDIELDDRDGQLILPRSGASVAASIGWRGGASVRFTGKTDEPHSRGSRGGGMILSLTAHSADPKGKGKEPAKRHKDKAKFGDVAKEWGQKAGYQVKVDDALASIERDYWAQDESFHAWGEAMARELGGTFKIAGEKAVFVARGGGLNLGGVVFSRPGNIISWDLTPSIGRMIYTEHKVRWYDVKSANWKSETVSVDNADGAKAALTERFKHGSKDRAKARATSNKNEGDRKKGGGSVTSDGEPAALSQAPATVSGVRSGIDGSYRITTARHTYDRRGGYITHAELEQPSGAAGTDGRKATAK
jgi:phage protein D